VSKYEDLACKVFIGGSVVIGLFANDMDNPDLFTKVVMISLVAITLKIASLR